MFSGRVSSWNLRDRHMADTLDHSPATWAASGRRLRRSSCGRTTPTSVTPGRARRPTRPPECEPEAVRRPARSRARFAARRRARLRSGVPSPRRRAAPAAWVWPAPRSAAAALVTRPRGQLLQRRAHHPARAAPRGPEVDQRGHGRALGDLGEVVVARVGDPRQRLVAVTAAGGAGGCRGDPVSAPAVRALDQVRHARPPFRAAFRPPPRPCRSPRARRRPARHG